MITVYVTYGTFQVDPVDLEYGEWGIKFIVGGQTHFVPYSGVSRIIYPAVQ
jgi:hypothetical protein